MAYNFTAASSQSLNFAFSAIIPPLTLACWFKTPLLTTQRVLMQVGNTAIAGTHRMVIPANNQKLRAITSITGAAGVSDSVENIPQDVYAHGCAVFAASNSRRIHLNASLGPLDSFNVTNPVINTASIGANVGNNSQGGFFSGDIAEVGIWSDALTQPEIASLAAGMTCDKVRPQSLVFYAPLIRDLLDYRGGLTITNNNGATVTDNPRIYA